MADDDSRQNYQRPEADIKNAFSKHNLPLNHLIYSPLKGCIDAQISAAEKAIDYVFEQGFDLTEDNSGNTSLEPKMVDFSYEKSNSLGLSQGFVLSVPFLTMIPIPTFNVESIQIDFLAKLNSMSSYDTKSNQAQANSETGTHNDPTDLHVRKHTYQGRKATLDESSIVSNTNVQVVDAKQDASGSKVTREYSYNIIVKASSKELPTGMERVLDTLINAVKDVAETSQSDQLAQIMGENAGATLPAFSELGGGAAA